jgi:DNA repair exonuclease SbcCD ATPase subunit/UDP-2,3-diacylglucosamine pyrophosphatase LpxH
MIINKVYHLADLHIRNLQRHKEYRLVFKKFLKQVEKDNIQDSVIYLGGDIAHAKTEMSPELIQEISWFLTECAKLRETILITGNHDCNLNNNHRLDVLTPIVDNLNNPRIHYLRDTGVYNIHNLTFVVYSILDDKENWPKGKDVEGEHKIALFHGPVNKSQTDIGYTVSSNSFTTDMFDGFDMVLMGDIHKRQILQAYEPENGLPVISYCGSMIQQNHGEVLENHGYLLWDIPTRGYEEFDIHNDYGFLTVDVVDGEIPQWVYDEVDTKLPKHPRLRLRFTNTEASDMKLRIAELKKIFKVAEVTVTRTDTMGQLRTNSKLNKNIVGNVKDETFQNSLIRDYLERQYLLEDSDLDKITELNKDLNTQIDDSDSMGNILWTPKEFKFSNMFSYGEDNKVRFDRAQGIIGIFAPNASGKSSLWDALSFCIYDKTSRTNSSKNILNNRKDKFYCKFHFEIDGISYFIERTAKYVRKGTAVKVDVNFWKEDGFMITSLNGEQRRDTNANIEKYLGKFEDFVLTTLSLQGNNALFIDKSQSERKEILSQFIGVDIFDKLYQKAGDENRDNATLIRKFKSDDFTQKLADIESSLKSNKSEYKLLEIEQESAKSKEDELNKEIIKLNGKIVKLNADSGVSVDELEKRLKTLEDKQEEILNQKGSLQERITHREELQVTLEEILDQFDEEDLEVKINELKDSKESLRTLESNIEKVKIKLESLYERKEHLNSHKYDEQCDICMENSQSIREQKAKVNSDIQDGESYLEEFNESFSKLSLLVDSLKVFQEEWDKYQEAKDKENKLDRELSGLINNLSTTETEEIRLETQVGQQKQLIEEYYKNEEQIKLNKEVRDELTIVRSELDKIKQVVKKSNSDILSLNGKISALQNQKESIELRISEVKDLEEQSKLFDYYLNALSKDGVSYELIEKSLPMIEGEVNNILGQIVDFGMQLEIDGKNINAYLVYGDQRWSLEMCSGMERFISGLAIRVALINVCNLPRPNFLVIDEGFGTLDSENLQSLFMLFTYLKTQFDFVMIISHIDSMRDVVDDLIEIKKIEGFSQVKY